MYDASNLDVETSVLPIPKGYKLLIYVPELKKKTAGGILIPEASLDREKTASIVGLVLAKGPDAYGDLDKFKSGPWVEEGDWAMFHSYSGTRFRVAGKEYRLINDDTIEAIVPKPEVVERA